MNAVRSKIFAAVCSAPLAVCSAPPTLAQSPSTNPLLTAPMPKCGPLTPVFERYLERLKQRTAWRGAHENAPGELELTVGRNGAWFLFFHSLDAGKQKMVCLIARGGNSRELFGRPV